MHRQQTKQIKKDLERKMVFLVGPRQVGKTWLAKEIANDFENAVYLNYDRYDDRQIIKKEQWPKNTDFLILDELHKMKGWKNYIKGVYDTKEANLKILITGSARLDTFRQSGDSLAGRFYLHRLMPFSLSELKNEPEYSNIDRFMERGGFPEPFLAESSADADRWRSQYADGLVRDDVFNFEKINNLRAIGMALDMLRRKVGSPVSYVSIAEDIQVSPATAKRYVEILESLYIVFRITPYSKKIARSILKEPKIYFFDTGMVVGDQGVKFENFAAVSFLKNALAKTDSTGKKNEVKYFRAKDGKEVDFVLVEDGKILEMVEVKLADENLSGNLAYFSKKYGIKGTQIVKDLKREKTIGDIDIVDAGKYLKKLFL